MSSITLKPTGMPPVYAPRPALRRRFSEPLPAGHRVARGDSLEAPIGSPALQPRALTLSDKRSVFTKLLRTSVDYRQVMIPSWTHSLGNGMVSGCFIGLFTSLGGLSAAQSFMAYALVESGQMLMFGLLNIYGAHNRDQARTLGSEPPTSLRVYYKTQLASMCGVDAVLSATLIGVALALNTGSFGILPALLAARLIMTCKNSYEINLFTCIRQLGRNPLDVERARRAGQALLGMEMLVSTTSYHFAALLVQFLLLRTAATAMAPVTVAAVLVGACMTGLPKAYVYFCD